MTTGQPCGQSCCGSGDGWKRRYFGVYHSLRNVHTFAKFITIIPARTSTVEIIYSFIEFQVSHTMGLVNFEFSLIFVDTLLTSCQCICLILSLCSTSKFLATRLMCSHADNNSSNYGCQYLADADPRYNSDNCENMFYSFTPLLSSRKITTVNSLLTLSCIPLSYHNKLQ